MPELPEVETVAVGRRGKILVIEAGDRTLLFHLKMTGQFLWLPPGRPRDRHTHLVFTFADSPWELRFRDVRKFGFVRWLIGNSFFAQSRLPIRSCLEIPSCPRE